MSKKDDEDINGQVSADLEFTRRAEELLRRLRSGKTPASPSEEGKTPGSSSEEGKTPASSSEEEEKEKDREKERNSTKHK